MHTHDDILTSLGLGSSRRDFLGIGRPADSAYDERDIREAAVERGVEIFAALTYFALGLSHIVQPRAWAELFLLLKSQGKAGVFLDGFINLLLGAIIVSFHND